MIMWEIILKVVPFTPIFYWIFSKTFRIAKKRKFYDTQINILDEYIKDYYKNDSIEYSLKDLKARQVTCNDWVGVKFLDYAIEKKCPNIFIAIEEFDKAWLLIKFKESNTGEIQIISKFSEIFLRNIFFLTVGIYFFLGFSLILNKSLIILLGFFNIPPLLFDRNIYDYIGFVVVLMLIISSLFLLVFGNCISSLIALSKKLPIEFPIHQNFFNRLKDLFKF